MKRHKSWLIRVQVIVALVLFLSAAAPLGIGAAHTPAAFSCSQTSGMEQADCEALVAIYQAAGGENWVNPAGWLQTNTPCSWAGVNCSGDRVVKLDLRSQGLAGALPPQLGNLTQLELLWLTRNRITALPSQIGSLDLLLELGLEYNQLAALPPEIGDMTSLGYLWLQGNQLSALPAEIGGLTQLRTLLVSGNQLTALPDTIGGLANLGTLDASHNRLSSLPGSIGSLSKLMTLKVEHNALSALPAEIGDLPTLWNLMLEGNQLSALPAEAAQLTKLKRLGLGGNAFSVLPAQIGGMTALEDLHLHDNPLAGELPSELTAYPLNEITFYGTGWCLPASGPTREWVLNRNSVVTSGRVCGVENTGTISGRATLPGGASAAGVHVHLYSILEGGKHRYVKSVKTAADGTYSFTGLGHGPGAGYKVQFIDQTLKHAPEFYQDAAHILFGIPLAVHVGVPTTNINVELMLSRAPLLEAAAPTGTILTDASDGTVWVNMPSQVRSDVTITKQVTCLYDFPLVGVTLEVMPLNQPLAYMDQVVFSIPMTHVGGDTYQGVIPARHLNEDLKLTVVADCWGRQENGVSFIHVYDPVGRIFDQRSGRSVAGARLTLYQVPGWEPKTGPDDNRPNTCQSELSKAPTDPWSQAAPLNLGLIASPEMSGIAPGSPVQNTSVSGYYGWSFGPGCYYFKVEAQFYQTQFSPVVGMPLLSGSLDLTLARDGKQLYLPMLRTR